MSRALSFALVLALSAPAFGQTVDSQGAKQLSDSLARYVGTATIDEGILKVSVDGDAYRIGFDFGALLKKNHSNDPPTFNLAPLALLAKPRSDGTWSLSSDITPDAFLDVGGPGGARLSVSGAAFSAIYDPALVAFTSGASSIAGTKLVSRDSKDPVDLSVGAFSTTLNASKAAAGGVDFAMAQTVADFVEHFTYDPNEGGAKVPGTISAPKVSAEIRGKGVRSKALLELLDFALANRDDASLKIRQGELKKLLTNALPLWDRLEESYRFHGFTAESPVGKFTAADLSATTGIDGISRNGKIDYTIKMVGLTIPERSLPSWSVALLPTDAELHVSGVNIDLDSMARKTIEAFDLAKDPPLSDEFGEALAADFMANTPKIVLDHSTIKNGSVEVAVEGEVTFPGMKPQASVIVDIAGYDKIVQAVQEGAATDAQAAQAFPGLLAIKGFAKTLPDGRFEWVVDVKADGSIIVNGAMLKPADPAQDNPIIDPSNATVPDNDPDSGDNGGAGAKLQP